MKDKLNFYIDGSWVNSESKETIEVINPANEELIGHITSGTKDDINKHTLRDDIYDQLGVDRDKIFQITNFKIKLNKLPRLQIPQILITTI